MARQYSIMDYVHYLGMHIRNKRRQKKWAGQFEVAVRERSYKLPCPAVVQIIPTEVCNLRCPMCNQWGEKGYFFDGKRPVQHMDKTGLTRLIRSLGRYDSLISIHGGEPFVYKHMSTLLDLLQEKQFDVIFSTNGTLINNHIDQLAKIKNLCFLLSIDGDEKTHNRIRGDGRYKEARDGITALFEYRQRKGMALPFVIMNFTVCEWNSEIIEKAYESACDFGVIAINYNLRWFLTDEIGMAYEKQLKEHFNIKSSGAWRGWISQHADHDYKYGANVLHRFVQKKRFKLFPPYVAVTPKGLNGKDIEAYYTDYFNVFGNDSCFMPFYWARIHSNGELIFCPGHPDVVAGNVFEKGFTEVFNSREAVKFRKHMLRNRFPICNRCCGLYMTNPGRPYEQKVRQKLGLGKEVNCSGL